ncbi:hypothetical protein [Phenylobacterium sp.]|uniref:hypothetical protein n=1 Tax=Phenylobacterium sp. TaxID=1871053 RepID=UPI0035AD9C56
MSVVRKFLPKTALTKMMKEAGDISASEALRRADVALGELEAGCLDAVDQALDALETSAKSAQPDLDAMYKHSADIVGLCGAFPAEGLDEAARSLCDYLDLVSEGEPHDLRVTGVHIASMRLLHRSDAPSEVRRQIVEGLAQAAARHHQPSKG